MRLVSRKLAVLTAMMIGATACSDDNPTGTSGPAQPTNVTVTATSASTARVSWTAVAGAASYLVQRSPSTGAFVTVGTPTSSPFDDSGLTPNTEYRYRVATVTATDTSEFVQLSVTTLQVGQFTATLTGTIAANRTLYADTVYKMVGFVKVQSGATLTILPGTTILGDTAFVAGSTTNRAVSALIVQRGGKLVANGTATNPIVFTSGYLADQKRPGDWGGVVIVGNGLINRTANPLFTEGPAEAAENYAGGTDNADSSGVLRYVRIEFAGYPVATNEELNSLSMYAVGSRTVIEYVQAMAGLDDAFEWFGGAVDGRYLVSYETGDDHFDWAEGYKGRNQYLIGLQTTRLAQRAGSPGTDPRGMEGDGCEISASKPGCSSYAGNTPYSMPVFANFTLVGPGTTIAGYPADGHGIVVRRGSGGALLNGIVGRFPGRAINIRNTFTDTLRMRDSLVLRNIVLVENGASFDPVVAGDTTNHGQQTKFGADLLVAAGGTTASSYFVSVPAAKPAELATLDWSLAAGAAPATAGLASFAGAANGKLEPRLGSFFGATITGTGYAGAAAPGGTKWWEGWTIYRTR